MQSRRSTKESPKMKKRLKVLAAAMMITAAILSSASCSPVPAGNKLAIKYLAFLPETKTIKVGTTITWTNDDNTAHQLMSKKFFSSKPLNTGQSYSFKFTKKGEYMYMCKIHSYMKAKVIVE